MVSSLIGMGICLQACWPVASKLLAPAAVHAKLGDVEHTSPYTSLLGGTMWHPPQAVTHPTQMPSSSTARCPPPPAGVPLSPPPTASPVCWRRRICWG